MTDLPGAPDVVATRWPAALPVAVPLAGRLVVVVGGGDMAARKLEALAGTDAVVRVVAPTLDSSVHAIVEASSLLTWLAESFTRDVLEGAALVFAATDDPVLDHEVSVAAQLAGIPVNAADRPDDCTFFMTAIVRRGPVTVAVSTSGASPALASVLRRRLEQCVGESLGELATRIGVTRRSVRALPPNPITPSWSTVVDDDLLERAEANDWISVGRRLATMTARPQ